MALDGAREGEALAYKPARPFFALNWLSVKLWHKKILRIAYLTQNAQHELTVNGGKYQTHDISWLVERGGSF
jgi:hypothetical protein